MTARGRLQRAAVRFAERRQAGAPGDVVELEAAAAAAVRGGAGVDARLAPALDQVHAVDPELAELVRRWLVAGVELLGRDPMSFAHALNGMEHFARSLDEEELEAMHLSIRDDLEQRAAGEHHACCACTADDAMLAREG